MSTKQEIVKVNKEKFWEYLKEYFSPEEVEIFNDVMTRFNWAVLEKGNKDSE